MSAPRLFTEPSGVWKLVRSSECSALFCFSRIRPLAAYNGEYSA